MLPAGSGYPAQGQCRPVDEVCPPPAPVACSKQACPSGWTCDLSQNDFGWCGCTSGGWVCEATSFPGKCVKD